LSDPAYLPIEGQFTGSTAFTMSESRGNTYDSTGLLASRVYDQSDHIAQTFGYGITDDLSVNIDMSYIPFDKRNRYPVGGGSTTRENSGFTDPTIGLTWRAIEQGESLVNFDVFGSYSPDWVGARAATALSGGTEGRGGQSGELGVAVSHVLPMFTIYGSLAADFVGRRDTFDPTTGTDASRASSTHWNADLSTQTRLSDEVSIDAGISEVFGHDHTTVTGASGVEFVNEPANTTALHLAANYNFIPNELVGSLTYAHSFDGTSRVDYPAAPLNDRTNRGGQENTWGARLSYAFN
jgi:hypothetical protein